MHTHIHTHARLPARTKACGYHHGEHGAHADPADALVHKDDVVARAVQLHAPHLPGGRGEGVDWLVGWLVVACIRYSLSFGGWLVASC